jgi:hypothetical protein
MASSFTVNNGLEKPAAGDQEGQWGGTLNTNFDIIDRVLSGVGSVALSGTTHTLTTSDGALSDGQFKVINFTGALGANNTITISPNDQDKLYFIINSTTDSGSSGPYSIIISQGSGANVTIPNGGFDIVIADGAGSGAAVTSLLSKKITTGQLTTTGNVLIPDAGTIGSASDPDAISISSGGVVDFTQVPTFPNNTIETADIQDNAVTLAKLAGIARGKLIVGDASGDPSVIGPGTNGQALVSDGTDIAFGTVTASVALDEINVGDAESTLATSAGNIIIDAQGNDTDIVLKGTDGGADKTGIKIDMSENAQIQLPNDSQVLAFGADQDVTLTHNHDTGLTLNSKDLSGVTSINSGGIGVRNYINNPEFSVHQRGSTIDAASTGTQNDDGSYTLDQWLLLSDGDDIVDVKSQTSDVPTGSSTAMELDVETANKKFGVVQFIENVNCQSIIGQEVTLSFQAKATADLDDVRCAIISWSSTKDAPTTDIVSAWESEGTNPTLASNFTYENTPADLNVTTSFAKYSVTATIDTSSTTNVAVFIFSNVTGTTAGTDKLHIGQVQLERGATASDFNFEPYTDYLQRCQRYFQGYSEATGTSAVNYHTGHAFTTSARSRLMLITPMRTGPTITFGTYNVLGKTGGAVTSITYTAVTTPNVNAVGFNANYSTLSGFNSPSGLNGGAQVLFFVNTGGFFFLSAELGA